MKMIPIAVSAIALSAVLAACGSSGSKSDSAKYAESSSMPSMSMSGSGSTTSKAGGTTITIKNFAFAVPASVTAGAKLTVTNDDSVAHTITLKSANIDKNVSGGATVTITAPKSAGTYAITCDFHPNMHGSLVVK